MSKKIIPLRIKRPLLNYLGGKWAIAPWILPLLPEHRIYVEPFGGAGSILLRKSPSEIEIYNDLDGDIVNVFRVVRDREQCRELLRRLKFTPFAEAELYDAEICSPEEDAIERARKVFVRSYFSSHHASMFLKKKSNFASEAPRMTNYTRAGSWSRHWRAIPAIRDRLAAVTIENRPALKVITKHDSPDTLFFIDPPYVPETRSSAASTTYKHEMSVDDHEKLLETVIAAKGKVAIAGYPSALYDNVLKDWERHERTHHARWSKTPRTEVLWIKR